MIYQVSKAKYSIAGINTGLILREGGVTHKQAKDYLCDFEGDPEIVVGISDEYIAARKKETPHLSELDLEYMWSCSEFCLKLLDYDGFMLHASGVVYKNRAYLFSAPSGTGKSTHTSIWRKAFGEDETFIINDDKPIIRIMDDGPIVFGTPWSGKTDANVNTSVPLQGICFLERGKENHIEKMSAREAVHKILDQTVRPLEPVGMEKLLNVMDKLLKEVSVYRMQCNMDIDAALTAYEGMSK
ncbi:MAG: hypothetical protein J6Q10_01000 [Clostridia bacterium]|nr:hypothetical protein [Clostridia bacterium]